MTLNIAVVAAAMPSAIDNIAVRKNTGVWARLRIPKRMSCPNWEKDAAAFMPVAPMVQHRWNVVSGILMAGDEGPDHVQACA